MQNDPKVSATKLAEIVGISKRKIEENIEKLKKLELIERVGATRGYWKVKLHDEGQTLNIHLYQLFKHFRY